ncbi:deoxyribose-phosphate aldolase [Deinobacterium chartae]|uniref:Deoxyribose-phosphate aldolase n=1 Tax=Deinobacterium chartae TaxID=521158 RepID=A0A841HYY3_9DEIO|nr:deoxyribose-phosphate aldolase [Deinobacterium chartae]MBB6097112.1 deoxyribose-phosphate aldolase [Deinobacterium chartae]
MDLAAYIDHTLLKATATPDDIRTLCSEARAHRFKAVCVNPAYVALAKRELEGSGVRVATVCGFPLGATTPEQKADEARRSVELGADEVDMVLNIGLAKAGDWEGVSADIRAVREATRGKVLKVILETGYLSDDEKRRAAQASVDAGADFVKTSTGFGQGGATVEDVRLMKQVVGERAEVKASGGVRSLEDAHAMITAGATRIGTSSGVALVSGQQGQGSY